MRPRWLDRIWEWIRSDCRPKVADERGIALISVILLIMVLSFVSVAAIVTSTTELRIGSNFRTSVQSFYNADAGVHYAFRQIQKQYSSATLIPTGSTVPVHYSAPSPSIYPPPSIPAPPSNGMFPFSNWTTTHLSLYGNRGSTTFYMFQPIGYYANSKTSLQAFISFSSNHTSSCKVSLISWKLN